MADITVVAASVRPVGQCMYRRYTAGESMTPGQPVYVSANDTVSLTDASALATGACVGIVVAGAAGAATIASGEEVDVVTLGAVTGYSTNMAAGSRIYTDDDAGILADAAGTKVCIVGVGINASTMYVSPCLISSS